MTGLSGQHALITGGGTGVGAAIAEALSSAGVKVTLAGRREGPIQDVASRLNDAQAIPCDVTDEASVKSLFDKAADKFGPPDIVIANAGAAESAPIGKTTLDAWNRMMSVNLTGAFLTAQSALGDMQKSGKGRLIFIASTAGLKGYGYVAPYCAAKHGVIGLTRALAQEVARTSITVNAVCPGFTETPLLQDSIDNIIAKTGRSEEEARKDLMKANPQRRFIQPNEVADTVLWLCAEGSGSVTGQAISVSGGEV